MTVTPLYILNTSNVLIGTVTDYKNDNVKDSLDCISSFEFEVPFASADINLIVFSNYVAFVSGSAWKIFTIVKIDDIKSSTETVRKVYCEALHYQLLDYIITSSFISSDIVTIMQHALSGTDWSVNLIGTYTPPADMDLTKPAVVKNAFTLISSLQAVQDMAEKWGVEVSFSAELVNNQIANKTVNVQKKRGVTRVTPFTVDTNVSDINRTVDISNIKTRMYGMGAITGTDTSGISKFVNFGKVVWTKVSGKPCDKAINITHVDDLDAQALYGLKIGTYTDSTKDANILIANTWRYLQQAKLPTLSYSISLVDLDRLIGDSNYRAELGDTITIYDAQLSLNVQARIVEIVYCPNEETLTKFTLDNFKTRWNIAKILSKNVVTTANNANPPFVDRANANQPDPDDESLVSPEFYYKGANGDTYMGWDGVQNKQTVIASYQGAAKKVEITPDGNAYFSGTVDASALTGNTITGGTITGESINVGSITADKLKTGTITADSAVIGDAAITNAKIANLAVDNAKIANATITAAKIANATITNAQIANATIGTAQISDAAITNAKISDASINTAKIIDASITNAKIADATIAGAKIANATIGTAQIATGAITNALIGTAAIGTTQIADGSITDAKIVTLSASRISSGTLDAGLITVHNLRADSITVGTINGSQITDGAITGGKIGPDAVDNSKISDGAVKNENIFAATITGDKLVVDAITAREIASSTITANEMVAGTITAASGIIADAAITTAKIADASITSAKIVNASIVAADIADATITNAKIADSTITADKISFVVASKDYVDSIPVGGKNLILNSGYFEKLDNWTISKDAGTILSTDLHCYTTGSTGMKSLEFIIGTFGSYCVLLNNSLNTYTFTVGKSYTLSTYIYSSVATNIILRIGDSDGTDLVCGKTFAVPTGWNTINYTFSALAGNVPYLHFACTTAGRIILGWTKLEEGTHATAWSQAPEEIGARVTSAEIALTPDNIRIAVGQIGGNNLLKNSSFRKTPPTTSKWGSPSGFNLYVAENDNSYIKIYQGTTNAFGYVTEGSLNLVSPTWYTLEFDAWGDNITALNYIYIMSAQWGNYSLSNVVGSFAISSTATTIKFSFQPIHTYTDAKILIGATLTASTSNILRLRKIALYEGKNVATGWTPNPNEIQNSSIVIDNDSVNIDTQNFGLTLRDSSNNAKLSIDASTGGLIVSDAAGAMISKMVAGGIFTYRYNILASTLDNRGYLAYDNWNAGANEILFFGGATANSGSEHGWAVHIDSPLAWLNIGNSTIQNMLQIRNTATSTDGLINIWNDLYLHGYQLKQVDYTNKMQCGSILCSTADTAYTVTFPTAFPTGSTVRVVATPRSTLAGNVSAKTSSISVNGFTVKSSAGTTNVDWIAMIE